MKKNVSGFTIIELIVVIVIIGVLASITLVAYRGITSRANDAQTFAAAEQWAKAIQIYKARNGTFPTTASCLGANYKYGVAQADASGYQCRQYSAGSGINTDSSFVSAIQPYITSSPTPAMQTAVNTPTDWYRGTYYNPTGGADSKSVRIDMVVSPSSNCPDALGGYPVVYSGTTTNNFKICCIEIGRQP